MQLAAITPVILTFNEAANIERSLGALRWASRVVVVDSGSTDQTAALVGRFANASLFTRPFDTHAAQWSYALSRTGIDTDWVLVLDADHIVTEAFVGELAGLAMGDAISGFRSGFVYCMAGRPLRGSLYPPAVVLARRERARFVQDGHTQRLVCDGAVGMLRARLQHDDRKSTERWLQSQARYMALEAAKLKAARWRDLDWSDRLRRLRLGPPLVLLYCLLGKGLLFDGRAGWLYAMQRAMAEAILVMTLLRARLDRDSTP
jgi:glycosyltransferase involved in cell wall biosynthesis